MWEHREERPSEALGLSRRHASGLLFSPGFVAVGGVAWRQEKIIGNFISVRFRALGAAPDSAPESPAKTASSNWKSKRIFALIWLSRNDRRAPFGINFMMTVA